jgi:hypothetical protein
LALSAHLTLSLGWIGAVLAYLALAVAAQASDSAGTVRAAWIGMELTGWYVIVPLALLSLFTGVVMAAGTRWGLFRHYWVLISLVLTVFATAVLIMHMPTVSAQAEQAQRADGDAVLALGSDLFHPSIGLVVLLVVQVLNVYKPRGTTPYGRRRRQEERQEAQTAVQPPSTASTWPVT